jgi:NADP-dependent 3-hydroxy acid dehydrogenase YdfG
MARPWHGNGPLTQADVDRGEKAWTIVAPADNELDRGWLKPHPLAKDELAEVRDAFVAAARRADKLAELVANITRDGGTAIALVADIRKQEDVDALMQRVIAEYGRIDIVIANAGISFHSAVADATPEQLADVIETNFTGIVRSTRAALPHMLARGRGHIVIIGSVSTELMWPNDAMYGSTKAAVHRFARGLANEVQSRGIAVTTIVPGVIDTPLTSTLTGTRKTDASVVADAIVRAIHAPRPLVVVPAFPYKLLLAASRIAPALGSRLAAFFLRSR